MQSVLNKVMGEIIQARRRLPLERWPTEWHVSTEDYANLLQELSTLSLVHGYEPAGGNVKLLGISLVPDAPLVTYPHAPQE